jgi:hypothetical protein
MKKEVNKCNKVHTETTTENSYHISPLYGLLYESTSYLNRTSKAQNIILIGNIDEKEVSRKK